MPLVFCLQLALIDLALRGGRFYLDHPRALCFWAASAALLHIAASRKRIRPARALIAALLGLTIAAQVGFFRYYHAALDDQAAVAARFAWSDVRPMVLHALPALLATAFVIAAVEYVLLRRATPARPHKRIAAVLLLAGLLAGGPLRYGTMEIRTAHAATQFAVAKRSERHAFHRTVPPLHSSRTRIPSILYIVTESIRAEDYCGETRPCTIAPATDAALPTRVPLLELRSTASYTAISMSVLWTGLPQLGKRDTIATAPDLFDYVRAIRVEDHAMGVHYWTSHAPNFFERQDPKSAVDSYISGDEMVGHPIEDVEDSVQAGLDRRLGDECKRRFPSLKPPYVAMVHFSGTHAPYFFDDATAPYRPFGRVVTWSGLTELHRAYQNAIAEQDRSVAACVQAFQDAQGDAPHLVFFTSDHGESFGEHSAIHHGQNLYDEQIHVPGFIGASSSALSETEQRALEDARRRFVTHFDLLPTVLDALGIWDHFAIRGEREAMPGRSLLRPADPSPGVPITDCTEMWKCPLDTWGLLAKDRKIISQAWDAEWRCLTLQGGEREVPLWDCNDLRPTLAKFFPTKPNGLPNP